MALRNAESHSDYENADGWTANPEKHYKRERVE